MRAHQRRRRIITIIITANTATIIIITFTTAVCTSIQEDICKIHQAIRA